MGLKSEITQDMTTALKEGDKAKLSVLRMIVSALKYAEIEKKDELDEDEVIQVISRERKKCDEAAVEFKKGNRLDLAEKEEIESNLLKTYLPPQLTDEEITVIVKEAVDKTGAMGPADMGKVMGVVMPKVKGKGDGKKVNEIVRQLLSGE